jgi:dolichol-phosphate mannosyltransferase
MIYLLVPVYNEAANLELLAQNLIATLPDEDKFYVFSDDGSKDNSVEMIKMLFAAHQFTVLGDGNNYGPGAAFNAGFEFILSHSQNENDLIATLEADNTSDIELLPKMVIINRLGFDLVLASVYAQGGGFEQTSFFRKFLSFVANMLFRLLFDIKVLTLSSFYRLYSVALIRQIKSKYPKIITENGFICMLELLIKAVKLKAKIVELPMILHSSKRKGASKMRIFKTTKTYLRFLFSRAF